MVGDEVKDEILVIHKGVRGVIGRRHFPEVEGQIWDHT